MKLYGISGLGADKSVFQYLKLDCLLVPIDWINPKINESIENYSIRLSEVIETDENYGILGVSFGGLIAIEISKKLNPKLTILVSSAETKADLRTIYKIIGKTRLLKLLPAKLFDPPRKIAHWIFGAKRKHLLNQILDNTDLSFAKWAIQALTTWSNTESLKYNILKISGTNDKLLPSKNDRKTRFIKYGEHFMIVDRAEEISSNVFGILT